MINNKIIPANTFHVNKRHSLRNTTLPLHLMLFVPVALVFVFHYLPMGGIIIAFQKFNPALGFFRSPWVGLKNFIFICSLPDISSVFFNTIEISIMKIVAGFVAPIVLALMLNEMRHVGLKKVVQTTVYLPHFLSWVIVAGILLDVLSLEGPLNMVLSAFGFDPVLFLGNNFWFRMVLVISEIWKNVGFGSIIYLAAITGIDPTLYEAAVMDSAGRIRQTLHVTIPGILPVIVLIATLSLGNVLNAGFEQIFNLYSPMVYRSADVIDTYVYRMGLINAQYGPASAVGLLKSVVSLVLILTSYWLANRYANYRIF